MSAPWKTVRVFISSTFRDMHAERDWLVKRVFPEIRERLQPHHVRLVDIDLRWGITREQAEHNEVLALCLQEIDRCRPFFLGLLGERYGWIPEELPHEALVAHGWLRGAAGTSVTEMEILHGVLNAPEMQCHAFFYFRSPEALAGVPEDRLGVFRDTDPDLVRKLDQLKHRIRQSGLPVTDGYPARWDPDARDGVERTKGRLVGLEEFGNRVRDQLWEGIVRQFGLPPVPKDEVEGPTTLEEEQDFHESFLASRLESYVGRDALHQELMARAAAGGGRPHLLTGSPGSGKSAVLARVCREAQAAGLAVIAHFVGASPASTDIRRTLQRFCGTLNALTGSTEPISDDVVRLRHQFHSLLDRVSPERQLVLVMDSLDQLDPTDNAWDLNWLPTDLPANVSLIVSCAVIPKVITDEDPGPGADEKVIDDRLKDLRARKREAWNELDFEQYELLEARIERIEKATGRKKQSPSSDDELEVSPRLPAVSREERLLERMRRIGLREVTIGPWPADEREQVIRLVPSVSAKMLDATQRAALLENPATGNPLFLRVALEELRGFGSYENLPARIAALPRMGNSVVELFEQVITRLQEEFDAEVVKSVLVNIAVARRGLSEAELSELTASLLGKDDLQPVLRQLRPYLLQRGPLLGFFHRQLFEAVRRRFVPSFELRAAAHESLGRFFDALPDWLEVSGDREPNRRKADELVWHYLTARNMMESGHPWDRLRELLTSLSFLEAKVRAGFVFDLAEEYAKFTTYCDRMPYIHRPRPAVMVFTTRATRSLQELLGLAVRQDADALARNPESFFQTMWNRCWWYDCPGIEQHYELEGDDGSAATVARRFGPHWEHADGKLHALMHSWREEKERCGLKWLRSLRPPAEYLGGGQWNVLRGHDGPVNAVAYARDGRRVASAGHDGTVRVWEATTGQELGCFRGHTGAVRGIAYSGDGEFLFSASDDGSLIAWEASCGAALGRASTHTGAAVELAVAANANTVATRGADGSLRLWAWDGHALQEDSAPVDSPQACCLALTSDGRTLVIAQSAGQMTVWQRADGQGSWVRARVIACEAGLRSLAASRDGAFLCGGADDCSVRVWHLADGTLLATLTGHESPVIGVAFNCRRESVLQKETEVVVNWQIASADVTGSTRVWDVPGSKGIGGGSMNWYLDQNRTTGKTRVANLYPAAKKTGELYELRGQGTGPVVPAFSPDGTRIATAAADGTIRIWEEPKASPDQLKDHQAAIAEFATTFRGDRVATRSVDGQVRCWDVESGKPLATLKASPDAAATCGALTPLGGVLAVGTSGGRVQLHDAANGNLLWDEAVSSTGLTAARFAMDSQKLLLRDQAGRVIVWDVVAPKRLLDRQVKGGDREFYLLDDSSGVGATASDGSVVSWDWEGNRRVQKSEEVRSKKPFAAAPPVVRTRLLGPDLVVEADNDGREVARLGQALERLETLPDGHTWAGISSRDERRHLYLFRYEDGHPLAFFNRHRLSPEMFAERQAYGRLAECKPLYLNRIAALTAKDADDPGLVTLHESLGHLFLRAKQYKDALEHLAAAGKIVEKQSPTDQRLPLLWLRMADAQAGLGNGQIAYLAYVQAICLAEASNLPFTAKQMRKRVLSMVQGLTAEMLAKSERECNAQLGLQTPQPSAPRATSPQEALDEFVGKKSVPPRAATTAAEPKPTPRTTTSQPAKPASSPKPQSGGRAKGLLISGGLFAAAVYRLLAGGWSLYVTVPLVVLLGLYFLGHVASALIGLQVTLCPMCKGQAFNFGRSARFYCPKCRAHGRRLTR